jgi:Tat protein translocase TatB subunit
MIQGSEILIILLVALVVLGPQKLPDLARKLGSWSVELRRAARDFRVGLEAEVADLKDLEREVRKPLDEVRDELRSTGRAVDGSSSDLRRLGWVGPEPTSGPTSSDALADLDGIEGASEEEQRERPPDEPGDGTPT